MAHNPIAIYTYFKKRNPVEVDGDSSNT